MMLTSLLVTLAAKARVLVTSVAVSNGCPPTVTVPAILSLAALMIETETLSRSADNTKRPSVVTATPESD